MINFKNFSLALLTAGAIGFGFWHFYRGPQDNSDNLRLQLQLEQERTRQMELQIQAERGSLQAEIGKAEREKSEQGRLQAERQRSEERTRYMEQEQKRQQQLQAEREKAEFNSGFSAGYNIVRFLRSVANTGGNICVRYRNE